MLKVHQINKKHVTIMGMGAGIIWLPALRMRLTSWPRTIVVGAAIYFVGGLGSLHGFGGLISKADAAQGLAAKKEIRFTGFVRDASGALVDATDVEVLARILAPNGCILKEELFKSIAITNGYFALQVGEGLATSNDKGLGIKQILDNVTQRANLNCLDMTSSATDGSTNTSIGSYTPQERDGRLYRLSFTIGQATDQATGQETMVADFELNFDGAGLSAEYLSGKSVGDMITVNETQGVTQGNLETLLSQFPINQIAGLNSILSGNYSGHSATATKATELASAPTGCSANQYATGIDARGNLTCAAIASGSGGTVTSVTAGAGLLGGPITSTGSLSVNVGTGANQIVQLDGGGKIPTSLLPNDLYQLMLQTQELKINNGASGNISFISPTALTSYSIRLPGSIGTAGQVMTINSVTGGNIAEMVWGQVSFAGLTSGDLPLVPIAKGGTGLTTAGTANQILGVVNGGGTLEYKSVIGGSGVNITHGANSITIAASGTGGTVTGMTAVAPLASSSSTITPQISLTSGTLAGQSLRWSGSSWEITYPNYLDISNGALNAPWPSGSCSAGQALDWSAALQRFVCATITSGTVSGSISFSQVTGLGALAAKNSVDLSGTDATGTLNVARLPAFTGDITSPAGNSTLTLTNSGVSANTYKSVTVDAKGRVTAGTNPTTLSDFGITDAVGLSNTETISGAKTFSAPLTVTGATTLSTLKITGGSPGVTRVLTSDATGQATWQLPTTANLGFTVISGNYTVTTGDANKLLAVNTGATITLPNAGDGGQGFKVIVKRTGTSSVSITTTAAQTIDGGPSVVLSQRYTSIVLVSTGSEWLIEAQYGTSAAQLTADVGSLPNVNAIIPAEGSCQNVTLTNVGQSATSPILVTLPPNTTQAGCSDDCTGVYLPGGLSCTMGIKAPASGSSFSISGTLTLAANQGGTINLPVAGQVSATCDISSPIGTICTGGAIYAGSFDGGKYMVMPSGCSDIPAGSISGGSGATAYASSDFTPATCSGTDALTKTWNDGSGNYYNIPGVEDITTTSQKSSSSYRGSVNQTAIVAITAAGSGGYHAAARYCDKLSYGGYTDWYLPSKSELAYIYCKAQTGSHNTSYPQEDVNCGTYGGKSSELTGFYAGYYWTSTEYSNFGGSWYQSFADGNQVDNVKFLTYRLRCVRRF